MGVRWEARREQGKEDGLGTTLELDVELGLGLGDDDGVLAATTADA